MSKTVEQLKKNINLLKCLDCSNLHRSLVNNTKAISNPNIAETLETATGRLKQTHNMQRKQASTSATGKQQKPTISSDKPQVSDKEPEPLIKPMETENIGFKTAKKCIRIKHLFTQPTSPTTENRYNVLDNEQHLDTEMEDEESTEQMIHTKTNTTLKTKPKRSNKPSPIVIKGKLHCHKTFLAEIKKITKKNITLKYAKNSVIQTTVIQTTLMTTRHS